MIPVKPMGDSVVIAGDPQTHVLDLPATLTPDGDVITRWQLTDEDRARLAAGGDMWVVTKTMGSPLQPMLLTTTALIEYDEEADEDYDRSAFPEALKHCPAPSVGSLAEDEPLEEVIDCTEEEE